MKDRFLKDVKNHAMTVESDNGIHRTLLFKDPETTDRHFRITTWKEHLCFSGDMGGYVFNVYSCDDVLRFFRRDELKINLGYWTEKLTAISIFGSEDGSIKEFDGKKTAESLKESLLDEKDELTEEEEDLLNYIKCSSKDYEAMEAMRGADINDGYEMLVYNPTVYIQWCLYALVWGVSQYDSLEINNENS